MRYIAPFILFCSCLTVINAKEANDNSKGDKKSKKKEQVQKSADYKAFDPHVDVTPTARTCSKRSGVYLTGSYIYWKPEIENVPIVGLYSAPPPNGNGVIQLKHMHFDWASGFKAGVGYNFKRDRWDTLLNWTRLHSQTHKSFHASPVFTGPIQPFAPGLLAIFADTIQSGGNVQNVFSADAKSKWDLDFDTLDLELGRSFFLGRFLSLRPFAGLKGAIINQHFKTEYFNNLELDSNNTTTAFDYTKFITRQDHDAIGPRIGINTRWKLFREDIAFDANAAFSLLWSKLEIKTQGTIPSYNIVDTIGDNKTFMQPVFELYLGFDWRHCWNWFALNIGAGYEIQYWLNETQMFEAPPNREVVLNYINLVFQGLTANVKLEF